MKIDKKLTRNEINEKRIEWLQQVDWYHRGSLGNIGRWEATAIANSATVRDGILVQCRSAIREGDISDGF